MVYTSAEFSISDGDDIKSYLDNISPTTFVNTLIVNDRIMIQWL